MYSANNIKVIEEGHWVCNSHMLSTIAISRVWIGQSMVKIHA